MADFRIAVGETTPAFQRTLKSDNVAVDLTGATVTFSLIKHGLAYINNAATTAVTPASGIVKYVWQAGDLTDTGHYTATFKVVYPSTAIEYFEFTIEVIDGAGIVAPVTPPALDFATQVELDAHINDATAAHAASAISNTPAGSIAATTVQAALNELDTEKLATGAAAGGVLSGTYPNPSFAADMATQAELDAHTGSATAHTAANITNTPAGNIVATTVQAAINELDSEKAIDTAVVHLTGNESIGGDKTLTGVTQTAHLGVNVAAATASMLNVGGAPSGTGTPQAGISTAITSNGSPSALYGLQISTVVGASQSVTTAQGFRLNAVTKGSGATLTNAYGFIAPPQTAGTNNYTSAFGASATATVWISYDADNTAATAGIAFGQSRDTNLYRSAANTLKTDDKFIAALGLGVGNSAAATTLGSVTRKIEVFDASGTSLGFIPVYNAIT